MLSFMHLNEYFLLLVVFYGVNLTKRPQPEIYFSYKPSDQFFKGSFEVTLVEYGVLLPFMARPLSPFTDATRRLNNA